MKTRRISILGGSVLAAFALASVALAVPAFAGSVAPAASRVEATVVPVGQGTYAPDLVRVPVGRDLDVQVWTDAGDGGLVRIGETMNVNFRTSRDAYVAVYDIDPAGNARLLFPEDPRDDGYVRGGRTVSLPGRGAGYRLMVTGPSGSERIVAVASDRPLAGRWREFAEEDLRDASYRGADRGRRSYAVGVGAVLDSRGGPTVNVHGVVRSDSRLAPVSPQLVRVPVRDAVSRDETWFEVTASRGRGGRHGR